MRNNTCQIKVTYGSVARLYWANTPATRSMPAW